MRVLVPNRVRPRSAEGSAVKLSMLDSAEGVDVVVNREAEALVLGLYDVVVAGWTRDEVEVVDRSVGPSPSCSGDLRE